MKIDKKKNKIILKLNKKELIELEKNYESYRQIGHEKDISIRLALTMIMIGGRQ